MMRWLLVVGAFLSSSLFAADYGKCPFDVEKDVKGCVVIISDAKSQVGSGFIVEMDGGKWLLTSRYVVFGLDAPRASTMSGQIIDLACSDECAVGRDLIRFKLGDDFKALKLRDSALERSENVWVFGNGGGEDIITGIGGKVLRSVNNEVRISAKFAVGDSGGPVVDAKGEVIGVAVATVDRGDNGRTRRNASRSKAVRRSVESVNNITWKLFDYPRHLADSRQVRIVLNRCRGFIRLSECTAASGGKGTIPVAANAIDPELQTAIDADAQSRKVYENMVKADAAYASARNIYLKAKQRLDSGEGGFGNTGKTALSWKEKALEDSYIAMFKSRQEGLALAKETIRECSIRDEGGISEIEEVRHLVHAALSEFNAKLEKLAIN